MISNRDCDLTYRVPLDNQTAGLEQLLNLNGFRQHKHWRMPESLHYQFAVGIPGNDDHWKRPIGRANLLKHGRAVHPRELEIEEDQARLIFAHEFKPFLARGSRRHREPLLAKNPADEVPDRFLVVDDEDVATFAAGMEFLPMEVD